MTQTEKLLEFRDQFCCIELIVAMVTDPALQITTSSIYPDISGDSASADKLKLKLKNLYYTPNSVINLAESEVLLGLINTYFDEPGKLSSVVMGDTFTELLVDTTATVDAEDKLKVMLGNANYRCAFANIDTLEFTEQTALTPDEVVILSSNEQGNLALLIHNISSNSALRKSIYESDQLDTIVNQLGGVTLPNGQNIAPETADIIAKYLVANDVCGLTSFLGTNTYKASW